MNIDPHILLSPDAIQNPYPFYDLVRRHSPVWEVGGSGIFLVTAFDPLAEAARRIEDFSSEMPAFLYRDEQGLPATIPISVGPPTLAIADPPTHTLHKQLIFPRFVSKRMALIEEDLVSYTEACLDRIDALSHFDFMEQVGGAVPVHAISRLMGFRENNEQALLKAAYDSSEMTGGTMTLAELHQAHMRSNDVGRWLEAQLDERDGEGADDLLDAIKAAIISDSLSKGQALITMITLLSAGAESTASLLGNAVRILAERPELVNQLRQNPDLLSAFIEEAGRLESPFRHHLRSVPRDTTLSGVSIPAGSTMMLMWGAANRDPAKFENPGQITLKRRQQHVTFGRGIHLCVGAALARMEARIVLGAMLRRDRFPVLSSSEAPEWEYSVMVRRHKRLPMAWY